MLMWILIILLICSLAGGGFYHGTYGAGSWSPAGLIVVVLVVLLLMGRL